MKLTFDFICLSNGQFSSEMKVGLLGMLSFQLIFFGITGFEQLFQRNCVGKIEYLYILDRVYQNMMRDKVWKVWTKSGLISVCPKE